MISWRPSNSAVIVMDKVNTTMTSTTTSLTSMAINTPTGSKEIKAPQNSMKTEAAAAAAAALCQVRCVARMTSPKLGITRLRLSVSEPCCVFPSLARTRKIVSFTFRKDGWNTTGDGLCEQFTAY